MQTNTTVALGIDPGYDRLGWAIGEIDSPRLNLLDQGYLQTPAKQDLATRYQLLEKKLIALIEQYQPQQLAVETLYYAKNKKTALKVSESRGVVLNCAAKKNMTIFEYAPNQIKLAVTGDGHADKKAVEKMLRLQLSLPDREIIDDAIDAIAILLTHTVTRR